MRSDHRSAIFPLLALLAAGFGLALPAAAAELTNAPGLTATNSDAVIARGKGFEIKRSRLEEVLAMMRARHPGAWETFSQADKDQVQAVQLDGLLTETILLGRATEADRAKGTENADKSVTKIKTETPAEELTQMLKQIGLSEAQWRARMVDISTCDEVVEREVASQVVISEETLKKTYDEGAEFVDSPELVRTAHVLISTKETNDPSADVTERKDLPEAKKAEKKKLAESIRERAKKGEDFGKLVKEFSDDPGSKDKGGEYTFPRGQMMPEFEDAAFALGSNEISEVVSTDLGYHVIKGLGKTPAVKKPFADVKGEIKEALVEDAVQSKMPEYLAGLKKAAQVEILEESLKLKPEPESTNGPALTLPLK